MDGPTGASDLARAPNDVLETPPLPPPGEPAPPPGEPAPPPVQATPPPVQATPPPVQAARPPVQAAPPPAVQAAPPPRPCQIVFEGLTASEPPRTEVRAWLERLGALTAPMTGGEVAIEAVDQGRKERQYRVRMQLAMPAGAVIVGPNHPGNAAHEDVYVAIRNAFRAARRQLELQLQADPQGAPR